VDKKKRRAASSKPAARRRVFLRMIDTSYKESLAEGVSILDEQAARAHAPFHNHFAGVSLSEKVNVWCGDVSSPQHSVGQWALRPADA
jgi:hypothetical protein